MNKTKTKRTQARCLPWFGADTTVAKQYAALLDDCKHVTVPFCGGLSIVAHLVETANEIVCNDKHGLAINFYTCIADPELRADLLERLHRVPFHQALLAEAQEMCRAHDVIESSDVVMAFHYFVTCWMGRSGRSGTKSEFSGGLAMRWDAGGGSSPLRFQTAVRSIQDVWGTICERCSFVCMDWSEILDRVKDDPACGVYVDAPWPSVGDDYVHQFIEADHRWLKRALTEFKKTKIVIRYGDNPLIRELYGSGFWHIRQIGSRDQANGDVAEICITNFEQEHDHAD